jgi:hypothetical protein
MNAGQVAFIIVAWNNKDILGDCLKSVEAQDYKNHKVILVDNDSKDGTLDYLAAHFPYVEVIASNKNLGFAKGNNLGISRALEDPEVKYVALLNSDARLASDWTSKLVSAAMEKPKAAMLQSITLDYYDHGIIDSTHIYLSHLGQATQGSFRQPIAFDFDVAPQKVFGCNAAAILITRRFIEAQPFKEFFDETMYMYLEDVDIAARATVMGWDNYVVPGTRAYHMGSASSGKNPNFSLYMTFRNNLGLLVKNLPLLVLIRILIVIPKSDRASILHLRRIGRPEGVPAVIKGRLISLKYLPIFLLKRRKLKPLRTIDEGYLWHLMRRGY